MVIPTVLNPSLVRSQADSSFQSTKPIPSRDSANNGNDAKPAFDEVSLSEGGRRRLKDSQLQSRPVDPSYRPLPAHDRPSPEQSAKTILGFIDQSLQQLSRRGADTESLEQALQQALEGFKQGLGEALDVLASNDLLTDDVSAGINRTEQLVLDGLDQLRNNYLGEQPQAPTQKPAEPNVSTVVQAYSTQRTEASSTVSSVSRPTRQDSFGALSASYAQSYQRNQSVDLQVKTLDGDIVTLRFNSQFASNNSSAFSASGSAGGAAAVLAYQRNASISNNFSFSVEGELDAGELDALNSLLQQVGELSEEFFNGDFDTAFAIAMAFEMDSSEFSSLSLDLSRSTRASIVESYAVTEASTPSQGTGNRAQGLIEQLMDMLEQAGQFAEPKTLVTELLSNQLAQKSLLATPGLLDLT